MKVEIGKRGLEPVFDLKRGFAFPVPYRRAFCAVWSAASLGRTYLLENGGGQEARAEDHDRIDGKKGQPKILIATSLGTRKNKTTVHWKKTSQKCRHEGGISRITPWLGFADPSLPCY